MSSRKRVFEKCQFASSCPLQNPMQRTEKHKKFVQVRYLCEIDTRNNIAVRAYAMVESFQQNYSAENIIDEIRDRIFSCNDPYNLFFENNTTIINDIVGLLNAMLLTISARAREVSEGPDQELPNIGIVIIRSDLLCYGIFGKAVFALFKEEFCALSSARSKQFRVFSNALDILFKPKVSSDTIKEEHSDNITVYSYKIQLNDIRFFLFTVKTLEALLECQLDLCTKSHSELTLTLYMWQKNMYSTNPFDVPSAGYLLIEKLSQVAFDKGVTPTSFLKKQEDDSWDARPEVDLASLENPFFRAAVERRITQFSSLTKRIRRIYLDQNDEMNLCLKRREFLNDTKEKSEVVPDEVFLEMENTWQDYYYKLDYVGKKIQTLMKRVQYELRPALEFLNRGNILYVERGLFSIQPNNYYSILKTGLHVYDCFIQKAISDDTDMCSDMLTYWAEKGISMERDLEIMPWWRSSPDSDSSNQ